MSTRSPAGRARGTADVREDLEATLGRNVSDDMWALLERDGHVSECMRGASSTDELAHRVREVEAAGRAAKTTTRHRPRPSAPSRARAIANHDAARVARVHSRDGLTVEQFRRNYIGAKLLPPGEEVQRWIENTSQSDDQHHGETRWMRVLLPSDHKTKLLAKMDPHSPLGGIRDLVVPVPSITVGEGDDELAADGCEYLTMIVPDLYTGTTELYISEDGVLNRLRLLAARVAREFGWTEVESIECILTGIAPIPPNVDTQARGGPRITLSVHPSVTPRELAATYSAMRRQRGMGARNLSEKHIALATFAESRREQETWRQRMDAWNKTTARGRQGWQYLVPRNFGRDAVDARRRMEERNEAARLA